MCVIKLVATDMDGTLLNDKKELPKDFCSFAASHKDIKMVIASGRQYFNLIKTFPNNADDFIFIADNGAVVLQCSWGYNSSEASIVDGYTPGPATEKEW